MASRKRATSDQSKKALGSLLEHLAPGSVGDTVHLRWPPDAFALCAYLLKLSGSYVEVLREWPPQKKLRAHPVNTTWADWVRDVGKRWRSVATLKRKPLPPEVKKLWAVVVGHRRLELVSLASQREVVCALLQLVAMADEASAGVGIPQGNTKDVYWQRASELLAGIGSAGETTLSPGLSRAEIRVLPKQHTPRGGLTLRSLTHHLALHVGGEVTPFWYTVPQSSANHSVNLLVAPWPLQLRPSQFQPAKGALHDMPPRFGFVEFHLDEDPKRVADWMTSLMAETQRLCGQIDGVVFPEAALSASEYELVRSVVLDHGAFLIAGVLRAGKRKGAPASNLVMFDASRGQPMNVEQTKHHRWRLDRGQIEMYGLGGSLDPTKDWWEHIALERREVHFIALNEQLSLCCLVCEDLARQDPVAELVRGVGPNLVVALLMDAPQLGVRWPARYATVLADDPGSSVLTVTSAGMVDLTRPPRGAKASRSVGLWKDARSDFVELELPQGAAGLLLNLCTEVVEEWTADGRSDHGVTGYPRLGGVHAVWVPAQAVPRTAKRTKVRRDSRRRRS